MGGLRRHDSPTGIPRRSPKESRAVGFAGVTGISRPLSNDEHWSLYYFEAHASKCSTCFDPLKVARQDKQLCDKGHQFAIEVASLIFRNKDGECYSHIRDGKQEVRVEIPHGYEQTSSLLKAIQRALRNGERFVKPRSLDRTYVVQQRVPTEPVKQDRKEESSTKNYETVLVEPSSPTRRPRRDREHQDTDSKRGSLYGLDMGELERMEKREQKIRYNLEVRQPSFRSHRRSSTYHD
jgi:hypothetical protein